MLKMEYLLEEAKRNEMPVSKKRGILREYLQVIILNSIYKHSAGEKMFFTGGTALRFFYDMPRFSEDLDFNTNNLTFADFIGMLEWVKKGLYEEGFLVDLFSEERGDLYVAEIHFKDLMKLYKITDKRGLDLMIKIEVYKPSWGTQTESSVLSMYGYNFTAILLEKGCLFAEKLCALLHRKRGRDIYDTLFLLKNKFPVNENTLKVNCIEGSLRDIVIEHLKTMTEKEIKFLAAQFRPFLFNENDAELIINPIPYAEKFLDKYK